MVVVLLLVLFARRGEGDRNGQREERDCSEARQGSEFS
jgi:hypothetical protein